MHPEADTWDVMKSALLRLCDHLELATRQATDLRNALEKQPPTEARRALAERDGTSYLKLARRTCATLDAMRAAYGELCDTIERRTAAAAAAPPLRRRRRR